MKSYIIYKYSVIAKSVWVQKYISTKQIYKYVHMSAMEKVKQALQFLSSLCNSWH